MNFTFGIVTTSIKDNPFLPTVVASILSQRTEGVEVLLVGDEQDEPYDSEQVRTISFKPKQPTGLLSKRKNLITSNAKYENVVYMHDYVALEDGWFEGFEKFGNDWDVCMNVINNRDTSRYRDWCLWGVDKGYHPRSHVIHEPWSDGMTFYGSTAMAPYDLKCEPPYQFYASGAYWVAKRQTMMDFPLDSSLSWGQGEDVEWSLRTFPHSKYVMNTHSSVRLLKQKDRCLPDYDTVYNFRP